MPHVMIIGGSDAGISAAIRAREVDGAAEVSVVLADDFPNYSICGLPFFLSGEVPDWHRLAHRTRADIEREGVRLLTGHTAQAVDPARKVVTVKAKGEPLELTYDRLILATGASPVRPRIGGLDLPGVYPLRFMADSFAVQRHLDERAPRAAVIVGGGYIGLGMADALTQRGLAVTVVEHGPSVMKTVDVSLGDAVRAELERHGVETVGGVAVKSVTEEGGRLVVRAEGFERGADLVLVAVGARPVTDLALSAGVETGPRGAIHVNRHMETNMAGIYAAGDCAETWHRLLGEYTYLPLGSTAHKQGRVAGENAVGGQREFAGSLGTQVVKVFDLAVARTGLNDAEARGAGFDPLTVETTAWHHKAYYPGAHELRLRVTGDRASGRLLGAQMVGHKDAEVAKRIDIFAAALSCGLAVGDLEDLDLSYAPPFGSPWDAVQVSGQAWTKAAFQGRVAHEDREETQ